MPAFKPKVFSSLCLFNDKIFCFSNQDELDSEYLDLKTNLFHSFKNPPSINNSGLFSIKMKRHIILASFASDMITLYDPFIDSYSNIYLLSCANTEKTFSKSKDCFYMISGTSVFENVGKSPESWSFIGNLKKFVNPCLSSSCMYDSKIFYLYDDKLQVIDVKENKVKCWFYLKMGQITRYKKYF